MWSIVFILSLPPPPSLSLSQNLRQIGVVGKFVEFYGPGVAQLSIADRATISNMSPEYGATCGFFAVDNMSLKYLRQTGGRGWVWSYSIVMCISTHVNVLELSHVTLYTVLHSC